MDSLSTPEILVLCGLMLGCVMGATARGARFCTFGAVEDLVLAGKTLRIRSWAMAIAVAMICVQTLHQAGLARIDQVFYLQPEFGLAGAIIGGLVFGVGMSMVGTCGYGVLVRMAGGDLKALFSFLILGISGYATARGLTSLFRTSLVDPLIIDLSPYHGQGIPHIISSAAGISVDSLWLPCGLVIAGALLFYCFRDGAFRRSRRDILSGALIGLAVASGFFVTGTFGADPFNPARVQSLTYVLPLGETLVWMMTFTGSSLTFAIAVVIGTFIGAFVVAIVKREFRWEGYDDVQGMQRHFLGAAAMGAGGVTALGCTIGQGVSGISTLAISPPIALASIFIGAVFGLYWLMTGSPKDAMRLLTGFEAE